ncbi:MAG: hypothetical protein JSR82_22380 [Verrucomicrobia bacterium]|nr:hypothetical protein [Verrucomicrobiota bacterium]
MLLRSSLCCLCAGFLAATLPAAQAIFSADAQEVFVNVTGSADALKAITVATKADRVVDLRPIVGEARIQALARARNGQLLVLTPEALFATTSGARGQKIAGFPARFVAAEVACHEASGDIVVAGAFVRADDRSKVERDALLLLRRDEPTPIVVATEGLTRLNAPCFERDGTLYFAGDDDLWVGRVQRQSVEGKPGAVLQAYRYAPLATPSVSESTGGRVVSAIALLGDKVCVELASGQDNALVRLPKAKLARARDGALADYVAAPKQRFALHARQLAAAEIVTALGRPGYLASTPDEGTIHLQTAGPGQRRSLLLSTKDAKPRELLTESD